MNPILSKKLEMIKDKVGQLDNVLTENRLEVNKQHEEKEALLQEKWQQRKDLTALERISHDYDDVEGENTKYAAERKTLRESLSRIVSYSKALNGLQKR